MLQAPRPRGPHQFDKPPLNLDELIERLAKRGLNFPDPDCARKYLQHIGYYRLSPYLIPFQESNSNRSLRKGTSFDDALSLYVFDRALRLTVMDALERIEVAARAALTDHMSTAYNDAHWHTKPAHFKQKGEHENLQKHIRGICHQQLKRRPDASADLLVHRSALEHYLTKYKSPELPPSWVTLEMLSIGQLQKIYQNLKERSDRTAIAKRIGLTDPVLDSWLRTYVRVRNICAHHGRFWNVGLGIYPVIPTARSISWLESDDALPESSKKRLYPVLISIQSILNFISPHSNWAQRLYDLISKRPEMNLQGMGIPVTWADDPFWQRHLASR